MNQIQKAFEQAIEEQFSAENLIVWFLRKKVREKGIELTEDQLEHIRHTVSDLEGDSLHIDLEERQISKLGDDIKPDETIDIQTDPAEVETFIERLSEGIEEYLPDAVNEVGSIIFNDLKENAPEMLESRRKDHAQYSAQILSTWRVPLDLLESLIQICVEASSDLTSEVNQLEAIDRPVVFDVLNRLQARACQVANEILHLLSGGYANGAHARWRSLHEISTIVAFIEDHDDDLAERYLLHEGVDSFRAMEQYQKYSDDLGYPTLPEEEVDEITENYESLLRRFGESYKYPYGWASEALDEGYIRFPDIERSVGLDHLRPFYKMASYNVHADPKGIFFNLSLFPWEEDVLLAGPSFAGLADPGQSTGISLGQITTRFLLQIEPNMDRLVACDVIHRYTNEIAEEFVRVQSSLDEGPAA